MNVRGKMRKLQMGILSCGLVVGIHQRQFYSEDQKRMITIYRITTPVTTKEKSGKWKKTEYKILESCSVFDIFQCLIDIFGAVSGRE